MAEVVNLAERMLNSEVLRDALVKREGLKETVAQYQKLGRSIRDMVLQALPEGGQGQLDGYIITVRKRESRHVEFDVNTSMLVTIKAPRE